MRWLRALRMGLGLAAAAVVALFAVSFVWGFHVEAHKMDVMASRGIVCVSEWPLLPEGQQHWAVTARPAGVFLQSIRQMAHWAGGREPDTVWTFMLPVWRLGSQNWPAGGFIQATIVPLWMVAVAFGVPWLLLRLLVPRLTLPGHCRACGYDLRSLAVGTRCPECGQEDKARRHEGTQARSGA